MADWRTDLMKSVKHASGFGHLALPLIGPTFAPAGKPRPKPPEDPAAAVFRAGGGAGKGGDEFGLPDLGLIGAAGLLPMHAKQADVIVSGANLPGQPVTSSFSPQVAYPPRFPEFTQSPQGTRSQPLSGPDTSSDTMLIMGSVADFHNGDQVSYEGSIGGVIRGGPFLSLDDAFEAMKRKVKKALDEIRKSGGRLLKIMQMSCEDWADEMAAAGGGSKAFWKCFCECFKEAVQFAESLKGEFGPGDMIIAAATCATSCAEKEKKEQKPPEPPDWPPLPDTGDDWPFGDSGAHQDQLDVLRFGQGIRKILAIMFAAELAISTGAVAGAAPATGGGIVISGEIGGTLVRGAGKLVGAGVGVSRKVAVARALAPLAKSAAASALAETLGRIFGGD